MLLLCWTSPGEICCYLCLWICTVSTLTTKCPELPCCAVFFLEKYAVAYIKEFVLPRFIPWGVQLNLLSYTNAEKIAECVCIIRCILDGKLNRFSQEIIFAKETLPNLFFFIHTTSLFWVVSTRTFLFVEDISVPYNSQVTQSYFRNSLYHCYLIHFFFFDWPLK